MASNMTNVFKKIRFSIAIFPNRAERGLQLPLAYDCSHNLLHYSKLAKEALRKKSPFSKEAKYLFL